MAKRTEEEVIQEVTEATEEEVIQEVTSSTSDASTKYIKTIPNKFDVQGHDVPDDEFGLSDLNLDEDQQKAFDHAIKCGIIKEVE